MAPAPASKAPVPVKRRGTPALPVELELEPEAVLLPVAEDPLLLFSVGELAAVEEAAALLSVDVSTVNDEVFVRSVEPMPVPPVDRPLTAVVLRPTGMPGAVLTKVAADDWSVASVGWVVTAVGWLVSTEGWPVTTPRELVSEV